MHRTFGQISLERSGSKHYCREAMADHCTQHAHFHPNSTVQMKAGEIKVIRLDPVTNCMAKELELVAAVYRRTLMQDTPTEPNADFSRCQVNYCR